MDNPSEKKAERVLQIEAILLEHPEGMTQAELARRLGVNRSTISRYFPTLPKHIYVETDGRWKVDRSAYLVNVRFNLHEALAVHLAARLLTTRLDRQNPHAAAALRKLGIALERLAPQVSQHLGQSADVMDDAARRHDPHYLQVLERLTLAWAEGRKLKVWHRKKPGEEVFCYTFSPYFLEPYAVGQTIQVIGLREPPNALRTFRVDRIERVETTEEAYEIPADFDPRKLLEDTWGIWYTDQEPQEVVLRFHPNVTARVRETQWHRSEQVAMQPDGYLLWRAWVAEPREMLPWIRGWGADVEVLEPQWLRSDLQQEAQRLALVYGIQQTNQLIAHFRKYDGQVQTLWDHLSGVSTLARQFTKKVDLEDVGAVLGMLHDLGKASEEYQNYLRSQVGLIDPNEETFPGSTAKRGEVDHSSAGAQMVYRSLADMGQEGALTAQILSLCLASHHSGLIDCLNPNGEDNFTRRMGKVEEKTHAEQALLRLTDKERQTLTDLASSDRVTRALVQKLKSVKEPNDAQDTYAFKLGLFIRFLFSCLIDADRLDTADFKLPGKARLRNHGDYPLWETLIQRLGKKLEEFEHKSEKNFVDAVRSEVSQACYELINEIKRCLSTRSAYWGRKNACQSSLWASPCCSPPDGPDFLCYSLYIHYRPKRRYCPRNLRGSG